MASARLAQIIYQNMHYASKSIGKIHLFLGVWESAQPCFLAGRVFQVGCHSVPEAPRPKLPTGISPENLEYPRKSNQNQKKTLCA